MMDAVMALGWVALVGALFFFAYGLLLAHMRWRVDPRGMNELRLKRKLLRQERDELLERAGLELEAFKERQERGEFSSRGRRRRSASSNSSSSSSSSSSSDSPPSSTSLGSTAKAATVAAKPSAELEHPEKNPVVPVASASEAATPVEIGEGTGLWTAARWAEEPVDIYEGFGMLYTDWLEEPDELTALPDLDEKMAEALQDIGVFRFQQIAIWNEENIAVFAEELEAGPSQVKAWIASARSKLGG